MYNFIQDPTAAVASNAVWFNFDDLLFESGKSSLKNNSIGQLNNLGELLKAYPNVKIKLGGYTDNTGDSAKNVKLSDQRARTVYNQLLNKGVSKSSFAEAKPYEGFGPQFAVADNTTEEGRAQNRRIAVSIRAK
jgi:outer membrane protein OmpA-like peptidoglycan-associated protein